MGFSEAVQWWEDWQLRLLVLASLFLQYFLFVAALLRKRCIPHWFRSLIWLAYLGCDAVAIYALATLFNLHKEIATQPGSAHLDTLWAPILLLHLGGQDSISAYSIEDNENWRRHLLISVSQITVAIYVFRKSWWSDNRRLLRAAILLFVPGILKCLQKPWALKNATVTSIINSSDPRLEKTFEKDLALRKDILSLDKYTEEAANCVKGMEGMPIAEDLKGEIGDEPYHLFVDLSHPYCIRLKNLQLMAPPAARDEAHGLVRSSLSRSFNRLYTRNKGGIGGLLRAAVMLLTFAVIGLFQESRRNAYARADVVVTYVLLCCTASLEFISACFVLGSSLPLLHDQVAQYNLIGYLARNKNYQWFWTLASRLGCKDQVDLLWCTEPSEPSLRITKLVYDHVARGWKEYIKRMEEMVVHDQDIDWWDWDVYMTAVGAYRRFNDSRGQRTLKREMGDFDGAMAALRSSLRMPFDESVLLWHLATEFCYFEHVDTGSDATRHSRVMSNYMAYLLFVKPEMLMPGARRGLFKAVHGELDPSGSRVELEPTDTTLASPPKTKDEMVRKIIQKVESTIGSDDLVHKAWELAHELMEFAKKEEKEQKKKAKEEEDRKKTEEEVKLTDEEKMKREVEYMKLAEEQKRGKDEEAEKAELVKKKAGEVKKKQLMVRAKKAGDDKMWAVIQGVWVEMLCFSAGRCRGYLHAKSLGNGGEYLSYVWLLLSYMGMETMPERMQRPELPVEGDMGAPEMVNEPAKEKDEKEKEKGNPRESKGKEKENLKASKGKENNNKELKEEEAEGDMGAQVKPMPKEMMSEPAKEKEIVDPKAEKEKGDTELKEKEMEGEMKPLQATTTTAATTLAAAVALIVGDDNVEGEMKPQEATATTMAITSTAEVASIMGDDNV
ncbi:hypothetical protein BAE44_0005283 [Dichanthelium oligosanthes]|uniref:DUF4220 domain-containing protein n=1 Tax=Dichanthelium oligosanthes TaxID=888268 RepID=A0A1E5W8X6_9POAL|nr:hypothetical protein BAE44_0005283 [Dichanthelium oligosanthes]